MCYKLILITLVTSMNCWDLNSINVNDDYYTSSLAIYKGRTFLAIPRSSCYNKLKYPTLIELTWTGDNKYANSLYFSKRRIYPKEQIWHACKYLQDVISVDVEINKGRLWILDKGNDLCQPKILIYNLYFNNLLTTHKLYDGIPRLDLNNIVLDVTQQNVVAAYVGDAGDGNLIELTYKNNNQLKSRSIKLVSNNYAPVSTKFMTISKTESVLYTTSDQNKALFNVNLKDLRNTRTSFRKDSNLKLNATFLGYKLGKSSGLISDFKGGLIYYMIRDYAVMRWDTSKPFAAEYHDVLAQSYETLPYVSSLFIGPNNDIWALVNPKRPQWCSDRNRTLSNDGDYPELTTRIVKLLKYNKH